MPINMPTDEQIRAALVKVEPTFFIPGWLLGVIKRLINEAWRKARLEEMNEERNHPPLLRFAIPKARLVHGHYYAGRCRQANIARWNAHTNEFTHWRTKFTATFQEEIEYWDLEGVHDGFIPLFDLGEELPKPITLKETPDDLQ